MYVFLFKELEHDPIAYSNKSKNLEIKGTPLLLFVWAAYYKSGGDWRPYLPVLLGDIDSVNINPILEPSLLLKDLHVVSRHLPLSHQSIFSKRPVLEPVRSPPLATFINPLIPELNGDLPVKRERRNQG